MMFQTPSMRGIGPHQMPVWRFFTEIFMFQTPSLRGIGPHFDRLGGGAPTDRMFQTPSMRGIGPHSLLSEHTKLPPVRFKPLRCGAKVLTYGRGWLRYAVGNRFQTPSMRGIGPH